MGPSGPAEGSEAPQKVGSGWVWGKVLEQACQEGIQIYWLKGRAYSHGYHLLLHNQL